METKYKVPQEGAVSRLRKLREEKRNQKRTPQDIEEMKEVFKKKNDKATPSKKIARSNQDLESP